MMRWCNGDNDDLCAAGYDADDGDADDDDDGDADDDDNGDDADDKQGWADVSRGRSSVVAAAAS